jgi:hypothetical protein
MLWNKSNIFSPVSIDLRFRETPIPRLATTLTELYRFTCDYNEWTFCYMHIRSHTILCRMDSCQFYVCNHRHHRTMYVQYSIALQVRNRRVVIHDRYVWMEELWEIESRKWVLWLQFSGCQMKVLVLPNHRFSCRIYAMYCCETDTHLQQALGLE